MLPEAACQGEETTMPPRLFVAATHQNVGKTMTSLGLMGNLLNQHKHVGYIKPVGQRTVDAEGVQVDEDALLMEKVFHTQADLQDMNPVRVGKGFTTAFINEGRSNKNLEKQIIEAYERLSKGRDFVVIEGTGHAGVGSVLELSNARVAKILEAPVVMVAPGGVGRPIDEVALNAELLKKEGVKLAGVIINKVKAHKYEQVKDLVIKGFERQGINVLGVMPYDDVLSAPTIGEVKQEINARLINADIPITLLEQPARHFLVGAMSAHQALDYFKPGSLIITPGDREDIILAAIGMAMSEDALERTSMVAAIILTGQTMPHPAIMELIHRSRVPVMTCSKDTYTVASQIHDLLVKISPEEKEKIEHAINLVNQYVDLESLWRDC